MSKSIFALALALCVIPFAALAQDTNAPPPPTADQRQAMQQFVQQEGQLHDQLRSQILSVLTPVHRRAIAAEIGNLAVSENPDIDATAKRIDAILSPGEQQRIVQAHATFATQSRQLREQMMAQMGGGMPGGRPPMNGQMPMRAPDAGGIVLMALPPHPDGMPGMMGHMMDMGGHGQGGPPPP
jgi:hypothetical protein